MICIDANVILEVIEKRAHANVCQRFLDNSDEDKAITMLTLDLAMYFVEKDKIDTGPVKTFLESFTWLSMVEADGQWAFANYNGRDFEDALQIGCVVREQCRAFVTLDKQLAKKYRTHIPVKLITPS